MAAAAVAGAPADGHTLFMGTGSYATSAALYHSLRFDPEKSFKPLTQLNRFPSAIAVDAKSDFAEFFQREVALYKRLAAASNIRLES